MLRVLLLAILLLPASAFAQTPSQKTIRIIVPFAPGASADGIARAISIDLGKRIGQDRRGREHDRRRRLAGPGHAAKSPPDGDTLGVGATGALLINPHICRARTRPTCCASLRRSPS